MGYFRIETGHNSLGIEMNVVWATPGSWTVVNYPCFESGENCAKTAVENYLDPSNNLELVDLRL
jgi:hypothetical protein